MHVALLAHVGVLPPGGQASLLRPAGHGTFNGTSVYCCCCLHQHADMYIPEVQCQAKDYVWLGGTVHTVYCALVTATLPHVPPVNRTCSTHVPQNALAHAQHTCCSASLRSSSRACASASARSWGVHDSMSAAIWRFTTWSSASSMMTSSACTRRRAGMQCKGYTACSRQCTKMTEAVDRSKQGAVPGSHLSCDCTAGARSLPGMLCLHLVTQLLAEACKAPGC